MVKKNNIIVYAFIDNKIVYIKCKDVNETCFDTSKLNNKNEENEIQSCIKKLREKTGIDLDNLKYCSKIVVEQSDNNELITKKYLATKVNGKAFELDDNYSYLKDIKEIMNNEENLATTHLSDDNLLKYFNTKNLMILYTCDDYRNIINMEII